MTTRRCWWDKFTECSELLYGRRLPLKLKGAAYKSYVRPAIVHGIYTVCVNQIAGLR